MAPEGYPWSGGKGVLRLTPMAQLTEVRTLSVDREPMRDVGWLGCR